MALATINPSALTRVTKPPLTETESSIIRERAPFVNTTSFNTTRESTRASLRYASASSMARSSNAAEPLRVLSSDGSSSSIRISVRNPRLPKLTPRIGMSRSALAIRAAIARRVPSPPSTTIRSASQGKVSRVAVRTCPPMAPARASVSRSYTTSMPRSESHGPSRATCSEAATRPCFATMPTRRIMMNADGAGIRRSPFDR